MKKQRSVPTYCGFHGRPMYWANSGLLQSSKMPCFMAKLPINKSDDYYWTEFFGNESKCETWHFRGAECASSNMLPPSYNGQETIESMNGYGKFNHCSHLRRRAVMKPYSESYRWAGELNLNVNSFWRSSFGTYTIPEICSHQGNPSAASARAWWTMQPRFEGRISMLNFLYELKDVKELVKQANAIFNKLRSLDYYLYRLQRRLKRKGTDPTKPAAELYLTKEFGIDPLIKDLTDIFAQIADNINRLQQEFRDKGDEENTRHYTEVIHESATMSSPTDRSTTVTGKRITTTFNATLSYYYDYKMRNYSQAFLKYWGFTGSAEALWNMIPFSFIVDYFIQIGKAIHAMEVDPNVRLRDYNYCESLKTVSSAGIYLMPGTRYTHHLYFVDGKKASVGAHVTGYEVVRYDRYPTVPNKGTALPRLNNFTDKQLLNMGALLRSFF